MKETIWSFKTLNFTVVCEATEPSFVDPWVHSENVIDAIKRGDAALTHLHARIYRRGVEVGDARSSDCIEVSGPRRNEDKFWERVDHAIIVDPGYRHKVVRYAIGSARKNLTEIQSELPDFYLRKTA